VHRFGLHRHRHGPLLPELASGRRRPQRRRAVAGRRNKERLQAHNVTLIKSDLFNGLTGRHYDLIVTNPPYVTNDETDALPQEYSYEPEMGLRAGDDGLDLVLKILRDAPLHLSEDGLLICEVGESEQHLIKLLPEVDFAWIEFKVGQMGIFAVECRELIAHSARITELAAQRP
jgi:ribosomal protein L3 glutamine methyltransferase